MVLMTCIQDNIYLSWQAELLAINCRELGYELTILSGWRVRPSAYALMLERDFGAILIEDTRPDLTYAPSIQPHLLAKYVVDYPITPVLLVDSDVLFKSLDWLPGFLIPRSSLPAPVFLSDCSCYLDARYLNGTDPDILNRLCMIAGIDPGYVATHPASGGAQYLLPHLFDAAFWQRIETNCNSMYRFMRNYTCRHHPVQKWTASMWAILYELYRREQAGECEVRTSDQLQFCFATDPVHYWLDRNILHMAGVTAELSTKGYFFKGNYTTTPPWESDLSHILPDNCSYIYAEAIKQMRHDS